MSPKARGELAEARLLAKAMELGFVVSKPFGNARYDLVVDSGGRLSRVQVKSAWVRATKCGTYVLSITHKQTREGHSRAYRRDEIDFFAAYLGPEDAWFIIPVDCMPPRITLCLSTSPMHRFARYREAWELMQGQPAPAAAVHSPGRKSRVRVQ